MGYRDVYKEWMENPYFDEATKKELAAISGDEKEIEDRFYTSLAFGTGGLRGVIGAGTNRMNIYTVRKATQGLANYIISQDKTGQGVAIAHDSRNFSTEFALEAACCLAANGIKAYVFESLRPTPVLSFAVRHLGCAAGINITASHNPPEYNGYKVYWEDGAQITPPHDAGILAEVAAITDFAAVKTMDKDAAVREGLFEWIGKEVDDSYDAEVKKQIKRQDCIDAVGKELKIVYTPLHGTGNLPVRRILRDIGFENVYVVPEQELPDGNFPTVSYPNPESKEAFKMALELAAKLDADLVLANDPDADRLGVYAKDSKTGEYKCFTGNMSGSLLADYELGRWSEQGGLPEDGVLIKTIVTTNLADAICRKYGVREKEVLTGFKYIGEQIKFMEEAGEGTYLFGFEESYGCLIGTYARDKDAVVASVALCEAAAYYKTKGKTLWDAMMDLYEEFGYYEDGMFSITMKGIDGKDKIARIMDSFRENPPEKIASYTVESIRDYRNHTITDCRTGEVGPSGLPTSNVIYFDLDNNGWCCARPSGTEPKIKFYYGVKGVSLEDAAAQSEAVGAALRSMVDSM
jgi:phosphoglucomutase